MESISSFALKDKKGMFLWADNDPYTVEANAVLKALPPLAAYTISGNYQGTKILTETAAAAPSGAGYCKHFS